MYISRHDEFQEQETTFPEFRILKMAQGSNKIPFQDWLWALTGDAVERPAICQNMVNSESWLLNSKTPTQIRWVKTLAHTPSHLKNKKRVNQGIPEIPKNKAIDRYFW